MQGKDEAEAQNRLSLFNKAIEVIEKQINDRLKGNEELLKLLESIKENSILIEGAFDGSKDNEQVKQLARVGKELIDELEQKIKLQNRNVAALLVGEFNKIKIYYSPFLPKEKENSTDVSSNNSAQSMSHFSSGRDIKTSQIYNDHRSSPNIFFQSAVTYGTGSPAYAIPSGTPNPSLSNAVTTNEVSQKLHGSNFTKGEKTTALPTIAIGEKEIQTSVPYDLARNELAETLKEKIKTGGNPDPTYKYLLEKLLDPAIKDNADAKEIIKSEMRAIREGVVNPNLKEYLAWCDKNRGTIPLNAKFDVSTIETYIRDKNEKEESKEDNVPYSVRS